MENTKKKKKVYQMQIDEQDPESGVFALSLVESPAIESNFIYLSEIKELIELKTVDSEKRLIIGAALIPNKEILRIDESSGEEYYIKFSEETVAKVSQLYLKRMKQWNTTLEHQIDVEGVSVVESWIVEDPKMDKSTALGLNLPKGSWVVTMSVENNEIWQSYVKGHKVKGISLEGIFSQQMVQASIEKSKEDILLEEVKRVLVEYLETNTSISSTYPGEFGSGSVDLAETYNDYPEAAVNNAKRALQWVEENGWGECGEATGKQRANSLANKEPISRETIARMASFKRHQQHKDVPYNEGCGGLMWDSWGGDAGIEWAIKKLEQIDNQN